MICRDLLSDPSQKSGRPEQRGFSTAISTSKPFMLISVLTWSAKYQWHPLTSSEFRPSRPPKTQRKHSWKQPALSLLVEPLHPSKVRFKSFSEFPANATWRVRSMTRRRKHTRKLPCTMRRHISTFPLICWIMLFQY